MAVKLFNDTEVNPVRNNLMWWPHVRHTCAQFLQQFYHASAN